MFINIFITQLRASHSGCKVNGQFVGAIMYADDLILLSASVNGLQSMLQVCDVVSTSLLLKFNCKKCSCCVIGPASKYVINMMSHCGEHISWSNSFRYLGIDFVAGKTLAVDLNTVKRKFYVACNCILSYTSAVDDVLKLNLWSHTVYQF